MKGTEAIAVMDKYSGGKAIMVVKREEINAVAPQYEPLVTVLEVNWDSDFTNVGTQNSPQYYPNKDTTNKIAEAGGVGFTPNCGTRKEGSWNSVEITQGKSHKDYKIKGEYKVIGWAQGYRIQPDGTKRFSSVCEYEFDCTARAELDFLSDAEKDPNAKDWRDRPKYPTVEKKRKHFMELVKFAVQRAETGAQLKAIRELTGIPTAFKKEHYGKPLVIGQTIENNNFKVGLAQQLMKTPDGRKAVADAIFNTTNTVYGPPQVPQETRSVGMKDVTEETLAEGEISPDNHDYDPANDKDLNEPSAFDSENPSPLEEAKIRLETYLDDPIVKKVPRNIDGINSILDDPNATVEKIEQTIKTIEDWKSTYGGGK